MIFFLSLVVWFEIIVCFILFFPFQLLVYIFTAPFDRGRRIMHYNSSLWCSIGLALSPLWSVKITGKEHLDRKTPHVVVMNHQSLIDTLLAFRLFYPVKMIGKKALGYVPIVGWNLFFSGHILVDRNNMKSQFNAIRRMETLMARGESILVFPEGTRTKNGEISEFKKGAFRSASATGTPLLPVVIDGPYQILPGKGFIMNEKRQILISILPPIPVEKGASPGDLAVKSREIMAAELKKSRSMSQET